MWTPHRAFEPAGAVFVNELRDSSMRTLNQRVRLPLAQRHHFHAWVFTSGTHVLESTIPAYAISTNGRRVAYRGGESDTRPGGRAEHASCTTDSESLESKS